MGLHKIHLQLAEKIDHAMSAWEHTVSNTPGVRRLDTLVKGVHDALLGGSDRVAKQAPFLRDSMGMQRYMIMPILICLPLLLFSIYLYGWRALSIVVVTYVFGVLTEFIFIVVRRHEITEGVLVSCMLFALALPPTLPLWMVALGIVFSIAIGKEVFGGSGYNIFNPAIVGRAFLLVSFPVYMTTKWYQPAAFGSVWGGLLHYQPALDALTTATPLQLIKYGDGLSPHVTSSLWDMFLGLRAGSLGESSVLLLLLGGALLVVTKIVDWRLTVVMLATMFVSGEVFHTFVPDTFPATGLMQMMMGGALFAAVLNITDPVTSPMTRKGKWWFAIGVGLLTVLIRALTGYNEGITFAILLGNAFVPLLDRMTLPKSFAAEAKAS